jgi:hypothetical protein
MAFESLEQWRAEQAAKAAARSCCRNAEARGLALFLQPLFLRHQDQRGKT